MSKQEHPENVWTVNKVLGQKKLATVFLVISCQQQITICLLPCCPASLFFLCCEKCGTVRDYMPPKKIEDMKNSSDCMGPWKEKPNLS